MNRLSETDAREGIELSVSTIADWVGACTAGLAPMMALIDAHVLAAAGLHGDDTTVPVLARGRTITDRVWTHVRDDRPFAGSARPAAMFRYLATAPGSIRSGTWRATRASCRPTPMLGGGMASGASPASLQS